MTGSRLFCRELIFCVSMGNLHACPECSFGAVLFLNVHALSDSRCLLWNDDYDDGVDDAARHDGSCF